LTREIQDKESDAGRGDEARCKMVDEDLFIEDNVYVDNDDGENGDEEQEASKKFIIPQNRESIQNCQNQTIFHTDGYRWPHLPCQ
jgi:hypothetical protein